jgi:hypothetical protein
MFTTMPAYSWVSGAPGVDEVRSDIRELVLAGGFLPSIAP